MQTVASTEILTAKCLGCGEAYDASLLACPNCHALLHSAELDRLAQQAREFEMHSKYAQSTACWNQALQLLPPHSKQAGWVNDRLSLLEQAQADIEENKAKKMPGWVKKFGPLAPFALLLLKAKSVLLVVLKLKFLLSFFSFFALYAALYGWRWGLGFAICILIHEFGHYIDIRRRGLPAEMPFFLPGLGAYVRWNAMHVTLSQIARISLAGPLAGWLCSACCFIVYTYTRNPLWVSLARTGAIINVMNLAPFWLLDGGLAVRSLGKVERAALVAAALVIAYYSGEPIIYLVALGAGFSLFSRYKPDREDWGTWLYFVAVLSALAITLHSMPESLIVPVRR